MTTATLPLTKLALFNDFVLLGALLNQERNGLMGRYLQYKAYVELVQVLTVEDEALVSEAYQLDALDMKSIWDWIRGGNEPPKKLLDQLEELLTKAAGKGGGFIDNICDWYCKHKATLQNNAWASSAIIGSTQIAVALKSYGADMLFFYGIPITTLLAIAIQWGLLEKASICNCAERNPA